MNSLTQSCREPSVKLQIIKKIYHLQLQVLRINSTELTCSWRLTLSYRNQSIDLLCSVKICSWCDVNFFKIFYIETEYWSYDKSIYGLYERPLQVYEANKRKWLHLFSHLHDFTETFPRTAANIMESFVTIANGF